MLHYLIVEVLFHCGLCLGDFLATVQSYDSISNQLMYSGHKAKELLGLLQNIPSKENTEQMSNLPPSNEKLEYNWIQA